MNPNSALPHKLLFILAVLGGTFVCTNLRAGSATWSINPISGDWYTAANWVPETIPNGPIDIARLGASSIMDLTLPTSSTTVLDSVILQSGGTLYSVLVQDKASLIFVGSGAPHLGGLDLNVTAGGTVSFEGSSTSRARISDGGNIFFRDQSSCFPWLDAAVLSGGVLTFSDESSAGDVFNVSGAIYFNDDSTADQLSILGVYGDGFADISGHHAPGLAIMKPYGDGTIFLGANNLTITSTVSRYNFSGSIKDGGASGGTGGSLTKVGPPDSRATFKGSSSYTGGTTIIGGLLLIETSQGSSTPTGSGDVHVNAGGFGGKGKVQGNVIVGTGAGAGASLIVGTVRPFLGLLSIRQTLTFASDAMFEFTTDSESGHNGQVNARGVTITSGAQIEVSDRSGSKLASGTVLTLMRNTATASITGTFANLPDGGTITVNANTYQADYEGGDGNDLTLTVMN